MGLESRHTSAASRAGEMGDNEGRRDAALRNLHDPWEECGQEILAAMRLHSQQS